MVVFFLGFRPDERAVDNGKKREPTGGKTRKKKNVDGGVLKESQGGSGDVFRGCPGLTSKYRVPRKTQNLWFRSCDSRFCWSLVA